MSTLVSTLGCAAALSVLALSASSPASAQVVCTTAPSGSITCTNSGTNVGGINAVTGANGASITETNSGTNSGGINAVTSGDNSPVTQTNSGTNSGGINAVTSGDNSPVTQTNSGTNSGGMNVVASGANSAVTETNSGSNTEGINTVTSGANSVVTVTNSGSNTGGINTSVTTGNAAVTNSGSNTGGINTSVTTGNAAVTNSGSNTSGINTSVTTGNATVTNSGVNVGTIALTTNSGNATFINSGVTNSAVGLAAGVAAGVGGTATLTNIVGGRIIGGIALAGVVENDINFQGGNWLFSIGTFGGTRVINTNGAPFVDSNGTIAVLDATTFALADRSLMNFTGEISEMLEGRFDGMPSGAGGGALGFAPAASSPIADQAQAAFSGIPSVAMSYASSGSRPIIGKAAPPAAPYYDTTVWASGFGGERHQRADGLVLPTDDWAFGGAMGVDRVFGPNLRLGAFVGAGGSRERVELDVQKIDATYVFGGAYGRFDWVTQYLDFALYGGGIDNKSTRQIANNTVPSGLEIATASYGGWFISPELIYGYRIPFNAVTVTPRVRLRYVGGELDGYSESGSAQNLSVGRRAINDLEERGEVELSTVSGGFKGTASIGVIGLERLGNPTINTVLLSQSLSFTTPGQRNAVGGVLGLGLQYRALPNVKLFLAGEGVAMSDKSDSFAATGGAQVAF